VQRDVLSPAESARPVNADSVALVAVHDLGQLDAPRAAGQQDEGKRLVVRDEVTWQVDANSGAISFKPAAALKGAPSPVFHCFADMDGNVADAAAPPSASAARSAVSSRRPDVTAGPGLK